MGDASSQVSQNRGKRAGDQASEAESRELSGLPRATPLSGSLHLYYRRVAFHTVLVLLSAALLLLIFPKFNLRFLAPIALTPLLIALARTPNAWQRFVYGWSAGIFYWFFLCTWIQFVLEAHGGMGRWGGWGAFFLFAILKGLHLAVFSLLAGPLMGRIYALPAIAALWTGLERTHATFGFAWLDLGNAGIDMSVPLRVAPFVGVYGVSFIFALLSAGVACLLVDRRKTNARSSTPREGLPGEDADEAHRAALLVNSGNTRKMPAARARWLHVPRTRLAPLAMLFLLWLLPPIPQGFTPDKTALVVQPNINPDLEWTGLLQEKTEQQLSLLSEAIPAPLAIWPELPAPLYYYNDPVFHRIATDIALHHGYFLFGTVAYTPTNQPLNSAVLLGPRGTEIGRYDKIDLVPFGEFVPAAFSFVNRITQEAGDFAPGHDVKVLSGAGDRMGVFICYESAFPDLVRQFTKEGANVLINLSNDAYFGRSEAREQHLLLVRMRAIETRRYIVRATNDGITAVIDPAGRIRKRLPQFEEAAAVVRYGLVGETTFYARHGDWFAWGCLAVALLLAIRELKPLRRTGATLES